jgi:hypothetical protein
MVSRAIRRANRFGFDFESSSRYSGARSPTVCRRLWPWGLFVVLPLMLRRSKLPPEPSPLRTVVFVDGQNLFHAARAAFGYSYPNYDVDALARRLCLRHGWRTIQPSRARASPRGYCAGAIGRGDRETCRRRRRAEPPYESRLVHAG